MLSKNQMKWIRSLESRKRRDETGLFVAEGNKLVADMLPFFRCELLVAKPCWMATQGDLRVGELVAADDRDIAGASLLRNPQDVIAVFVQPERRLSLGLERLRDDLTLALDGVQDPGNLGTMVRLADWLGIRTLVCSPDTVDVFNPKTVQATMGGLARVRVFYEPLPALLRDLGDGVPVYGAFLDGRPIYGERLSARGLIVMGNEGNGIRPEVERLVTHRLCVPNFPPGAESTESLNVAVAAAIVCSEFRRQQVYAL
jgi:TrmH family RNA methyltransferase